MNRLSLNLAICFLFMACGNAPTYVAPTQGVSYSGNQSPVTCLPGKNFSAKSGSYISWHVMKIAVLGDLVPLTGTNDIVGDLNIQNDTWKEAQTTIDFVSASTNSDSPLRDSRINSYIFGRPESLPFKFKLVEVVGEDLAMRVDESKDVVVKGILFLGGQQIDIEMPALIKEMPDLISITPAGIFKLNVRSLSPVVNGVNLIDRIAKLLSFVPGVEMQDEVTIDFSLEFKPSCNGS